MFGHENVSVLDGGLIKWAEDGYEITVEEPTVKVKDIFTAYEICFMRLSIIFFEMTHNASVLSKNSFVLTKKSLSICYNCI